MCQGLRDVSNLVWKLIAVLGGEANETLLDSYAVERSAHVRELTSRIKAIGHVICERDPDGARARDARILAEGGGVARTITRQEIVPKLSCGLLSEHAHPANGTLFPQPLVRDGQTTALLDAVAGTGWRLVIDARLSPLTAPPGVRPIIIGPGHIEECEGVVARWFEAQGCVAALVRPDHYVFGVAGDEAEIAARVSEYQACLTKPQPAFSTT
jgi:3-(3-hydroxy-phenyl)propionate hydroxylase